MSVLGQPLEMGPMALSQFSTSHLFIKDYSGADSEQFRAGSSPVVKT